MNRLSKWGVAVVGSPDLESLVQILQTMIENSARFCRNGLFVFGERHSVNHCLMQVVKLIFINSFIILPCEAKPPFPSLIEKWENLEYGISDFGKGVSMKG